MQSVRYLVLAKGVSLRYGHLVPKALFMVAALEKVHQQLGSKVWSKRYLSLTLN